VKRINHFEMNRPVHLALRDIYFERAAGLLRNPALLTGEELDVGRFEEILYLLRTAREHGTFAVRDEAKNGKDGQFCKFINMLAGNVKSVLSMLNLKRSVETEGGFFFSFLEANHASVALQAEEYERRARDIVRLVLDTLDLAQPAYDGLKVANNDGFNDFERERYDKAAVHHRQLIEQRPELPIYKKRLGVFS
jgi:hypothetical protein